MGRDITCLICEKKSKNCLECSCYEEEAKENYASQVGKILTSTSVVKSCYVIISSTRVSGPGIVGKILFYNNTYI